MDKADLVHIHNGILLNNKENEIMSFATIWMQLEIITLSEVSQKEKYHSVCKWNLKYDTHEPKTSHK